MLKKYIIFLIVLSFIFPISKVIFSQNNALSDTIVINNINIKTHSGEVPAESVSYNEANKWALALSLILMADSPPLIDNKAFFLTQYQTVIPVSGYKKELMYKIYFDFFRYRNNKVPFNSLLKIYIRDIYGNKKLAGTADTSFMSDKKIFEVSVPFDLSYPGKFDIIIHEYSDKIGYWGIWDIIVTSKKINEIEIMPIDSTEKIRETEEKIFK